jgi:hypothetical protein
MACTDCKQSIYNTQKSTIESPICQGDCPEEVNCNGETTYTDCVVSNVALSCIEKSVGATQTEINQAFDTALCNLGGGCYSWTELTKANLGLNSLWQYAGNGFERPAISNIKNCVVRLAGTIRFTSNLPSGNNLIGILPSGKRPSKIRRFSINIADASSVIPQILTINTNGEIRITTTSIISNPTLSFDGISFETGTII